MAKKKQIQRCDLQAGLDYAAARAVLLSLPTNVDLCLVGCGGTGSWLAPAIVRLARLLQDKTATPVRLYFVDPDQVEPKNCYRQNFCPAEVGRGKADALAGRYGLAWGMEIAAVRAAFTTELYRELIGGDREGYLRVLLGCVDNFQARKELANVFNLVITSDNASTWWIDCGNEKSSGQVLVGNRQWMTERDLQFPGFTTGLPIPSLQHPDLVDQPTSAAGEKPRRRKTKEPAPALSCADVALADAQGLTINQAVAAEAATVLRQLLLSKSLKRMAVYLDEESGARRSVYVTEENLRRFMPPAR